MLDLSKLVDNKISEREYKSIIESLDHIMIYFLEIPNGIDILWDYSNFFYYMRHIGIQQTIPEVFIKLIAAKSHSVDNVKMSGHPRNDVHLFHLPRAYYELRNWLEANKYYFVTMENLPEGE